MYVCTYVCMYVCMYLCKYVSKYVRMYVCVCVYVCMYVCMCVCVCVCVCMLCLTKITVAKILIKCGAEFNIRCSLLNYVIFVSMLSIFFARSRSYTLSTVFSNIPALSAVTPAPAP